jgi:anti-anti-sigma factor
MVEYEAARRDDVAVLTLRGELVGDSRTRELHDALEDHYVDDGVREIIVDLSEVEFVSLEGVAALLDLYRESQLRGKQFRIDNPTAWVSRKLATTGVLPILTGEQSPE